MTGQYPRLVCVALIIASINGCSPQTPTPTPAATPTSWTLDVEGLDAKAIPVEGIDATGLVVAAEPGGRVPFPDVVGRSAVVGIDDLELEFAIHWTASICATGSTIALQPRGGTLAVDVAVASTGGCDLLPHDYGVVLDLSGPVGDRPVVVSESHPDARSWGTTILGSDGRTARSWSSTGRGGSYSFGPWILPSWLPAKKMSSSGLVTGRRRSSSRGSAMCAMTLSRGGSTWPGAPPGCGSTSRTTVMSPAWGSVASRDLP